MPWNSPSLLPLLLLLLLPLLAFGQDEEEEFYEVLDGKETRSRMILHDGNIVFAAATNKNITFRTFGNSSVFLGHTDIGSLPKIAAVDDLHTKLDDLVRKMEDAVDDIERGDRVSNHLSDEAKKLATVVRNVSKSISDLTASMQANNNNWLARDAQSKNKIRELEEKLSMDACSSVHPCQNGGTCIPRVGDKYTCLCTPHRTGHTCEFDIDECDEYQGTNLGCQNNATCENIDDGFLCHCSGAFHGPRCENVLAVRACDSPGLCGKHGICSNAEGSPPYKCLCDRGYTLSKDIFNPTCIDVNECLSFPCHHESNCINLPGSFRCTGCKTGYDGNGERCDDVNECLANPCSKKPKVRCMNTIGTFHCDSCPIGFEGDDFSCKRVSPCDSDPCHPLADCVENLASDSMSSPGGFVCHCRNGLVGHGNTVNGCEPAVNGTICDDGEDDKCHNGGKCTPLSAEDYQCNCVGGYTGKDCDDPSPCISSPCKNDGKCVPFANGRYDCDCRRGFYGDNCEEQENLCGVHQKNASGSVSFPVDFGSLEKRPLCDLVISPHNVFDKAINIYFTDFREMPFEHDGRMNCSDAKARITVYDGSSDNDPVVAVYCGALASDIHGPSLRFPVKLSGGSALVRHSGKGGTYKLRWEVVPQRCHERQVGVAGEIVYEKDADNGFVHCEWSIRTPNAHDWIEFDIPEMQMRSGKHFNNYVNMLQVFAGLHTDYSDSIYHQASSTDTSVIVKTNTPYAVVRYLQRALEPTHRFFKNATTGFNIKWRAIEGEFDCGGDLEWNGTTPFSGSIETPGYPHQYARGTSCTWNIGRKPAVVGVEGEGQRNASLFSLLLRFEHFHVPTNGPGRQFYHGYYRSHEEFEAAFIRSACREDFVSITGQDVNFCEVHRPRTPIVVKDDFAVVQFRSKNRDGKGFKLNYEIVCAHDFTSSSGAFSSFATAAAASFPIVCTYTIHAKPSQIVHITLNNVNCHYSNRRLDYMKIHGNKKLNSTRGGGDLCYMQRIYGPYNPMVMTTTGGTPIVLMHSMAGKGARMGFSVEYNTTDIGCGGSFGGNKGTFTSPNFPNSYPNHAHCVYEIQVDSRKRVRLVFDSFDLEHTYHPECIYDHVDIYDDYRRTKLLGRYCGNGHVPPIFSTYSTLLVEFFSDYSAPGSGFLAKYEAVDDDSHCDITRTEPSGTIIYNSGAQHHKCEFHIAICGPKSFPLSLRSHSNRVFLLLTPHTGLLRDVSFNISYETVSSGCGGTISGMRGSIASPQYPVKDGRSMSCTWKIAVAYGNRVSLSIEKMDDLQSAYVTGPCNILIDQVAALSIYNSSSTSEETLLKRYCSQLTDFSPLVSTGNALTVDYRHTSPRNRPVFGFIAHFATVCRDITLTGFTGTLESPGYPQPTLETRNCQWTILVPPGNRIRVMFGDFKLSNRSPSSVDGCGDNNLMIPLSEMASATIETNGQVNVTTTINKFCDNAIPQEIMSKDNRLTISFTSGSEKNNHFYLNWVTIGCGGERRQPGPIQAKLDDLSSLLPADAPIECGWSITAPVGQRVSVDVSELTIFNGADNKCDGDNFTGLGVYSGPTNASGFAVRKHCDKVYNAQDHFKYNSSDNSIFILLKLKKSWLPSDGFFFRASISFVEGDRECGGRLKVDRSNPLSILSPKYPKAYTESIQCDWIVEALPGHRLNITVQEFEMPTETGGYRNLSHCDYYDRQAGVTFFGGHMQTSPPAGKKYGFRLEARAICGGTAYADEEVKQLHMLHLKAEEVCEFEIVPNPNLAESERVFVHFTAIEMKDFGHPTTEEPNPRSYHSTASVNVYVDGELAKTFDLNDRIMLSNTFTGESSIKIVIVGHASTTLSEHISFSYSTSINSCGGELLSTVARVEAPSHKEAFECDWTIKNTPGNTVSLSIGQLILCSTPVCSTSYLEIREQNSTGRFIGRYNKSASIPSQEAQTLWIRLRYAPETRTAVAGVEEEEAITPQLVFNYEKKAGGTTSSHVIENPAFNIRQQGAVWKIVGKADHAIVIHFESLQISEMNPLRITKVPSPPDAASETLHSISGTTPPEEDIYIAEPEVILKLNKANINDQRQSSPQFRLRWQSVPLRGNQSEAEEDPQFTCGEMLVAEVGAKTLQYPAANAVSKANENCRWTISRPQFFGIKLRIVAMDILATRGCDDDYAILPVDYDYRHGPGYRDNPTRVCGKDAVNKTREISIMEKFIHIRFVSSSRSERAAFKIEYSLTCKSFDVIEKGDPFSATLAFPHNSVPSEGPQDCRWRIVFASRRRVAVNITDLKLFRCPGDDRGLRVVNFHERPSRLCGLQEELTDTFTIKIYELTEGCTSETIKLDESSPIFTLSSPLWPEMAPRSLSCGWTFRVPRGHRMSLTFNQFGMGNDSPPECDDNFVEVNDGATSDSVSIGKFCGSQQPSTLFSTDNQLHVTLVTEAYNPMRGFTATVMIAKCGGLIVLEMGKDTTLTSTDFPKAVNQNCTWTIKAPKTHFVEARLEDFGLTNSNCSLEYFSIRDRNDTGNYLVGPLCYGQQVSAGEVRSSTDKLVVQFVLDSLTQACSPYPGSEVLWCCTILGGQCPPYMTKCGFSLKLRASKISCGGEISDSAGNITVPGYPEKLIPHVECEWEFRAGSGFRYIFHLEFVVEGVGRGGEDGGTGTIQAIYHHRKWSPEKDQIDFCNGDLYVADGPMVAGKNKAWEFQRHFCLVRNKAALLSHSDITHIRYHGYPSSYYHDRGIAEDHLQPFRIAYSKKHSMTLPANGTKPPRFCHISIKRTANQTGTTFISFSNYTANENDMHSCDPRFSHIDVVASESNSDLIVNLKQRLCKASLRRLMTVVNGTEVKKPMTMATATPFIDVFVVAPTDISFNLVVTFHGEYLPNQHCVWIIRAPEDMRIQLTVIDMDIEYNLNCGSDALILGEGESNTPVDSYCQYYNINNPGNLKQNHLSHTSQSRVFVLTWITDSDGNRGGWKINYTFVGGSECGFSSTELTGTIHTPKFPNGVPLAHLRPHWLLPSNFDTLDIQSSGNCSADSLIISELHSMGEIAPNGEDYLYSRYTERHAPYCGPVVPSRDFESQSNKIQLNFTSNDDGLRGHGFSVKWTAECGAVYTRKSGVVTSPHYPSFYPNADMTCSYLINPRVDGDARPLITIEINDIQLSNEQLVYDPYRRCPSDYLQLIDPYNNRTLMTHCGYYRAQYMKTMALRGPIQIKMVANNSYRSGAEKMLRGFKITYTVDECGGHKQVGDWRQIVKSPGFKTGYHANLDCLWNITTDSNRILELQYELFDIESSDACSKDHLEMFEGTEMTNATFLGKYCGKEAQWMPKDVNSPSLLIRFVADHETAHPGFRISINSYLGPNAGCGGVLNATGLSDTTLEIQLVSLRTERKYGNRRCWDSLTIIDGLSKTSSPVLASEMCTDHMGTPFSPRSFHSSSQRVEVVFQTDSSDVAQGFELKYRSITADCGGWLNATTTKLIVSETAKSKTREDQTHRRCHYHIRSELQATIFVRFTKLNIPSKDGLCDSDFVEIRDVGSTTDCYHLACARRESEKKKLRECGIHPQGLPPFTSRTTEVEINTATEFGDGTTEFAFEYYILDKCNVTIDGAVLPAGRITSPNFPNAYEHNATCVTSITAKPRQRLLVVFKIFDVENAINVFNENTRTVTIECLYDYLEHLNTAFNTTKKLCNRQSQSTIYQTTKEMRLTFVTDHSITNRGYEASYYTIDMIGEDVFVMGTYKETQGALASIGYPNTMVKSSTQKFPIDPPGAHSCKIIFTHLDYNKKLADGSCGTEEYVEVVYKKKGQEEKTLTKLDPCTDKIESGKTIPIEAGTTDIVVTFKTDSVTENDGSGFRAEWICDDYEVKYRQ